MNQARFYENSGFYSLTDMVFQSMRDTMSEAVKSGKHEVGSWIKEGDWHHVQHAFLHVDQMQVDRRDTEEYSDIDLEHALCRLAMALYCRKKGVIGDFGPDGNG